MNLYIVTDTWHGDKRFFVGKTLEEVEIKLMEECVLRAEYIIDGAEDDWEHYYETYEEALKAQIDSQASAFFDEQEVELFKEYIEVISRSDFMTLMEFIETHEFKRYSDYFIQNIDNELVNHEYEDYDEYILYGNEVICL